MSQEDARHMSRVISTSSDLADIEPTTPTRPVATPLAAGATTGTPTADGDKCFKKPATPRRYKKRDTGDNGSGMYKCYFLQSFNFHYF